MVGRSVPSQPPQSIILFDGVCNLCTASVRFILDRDQRKRFSFASIQSRRGRELLEQHGLDPGRLTTVVLLEGDRVYVGSTAALRIACRLSWPWPAFFGLIVVPRFQRDWAYAWVAGNRHRWFGKSDACRLPEGDFQDRFLS